MGTTATPQLMVGMACKVLGASLDVGYTKTATGERFFIRQDQVAPNNGVDLATLVNEINHLVGNDKTKQVDEAAITKELVPLGKNGKLDMTTVRFILTTVYLDMQVPSDATKQRSTEYAFRLEVDTTDVIREKLDNVIDIDKLTIAVWNTKNEAILKQMSIPESK